jgi:hypothetical protein
MSANGTAQLSVLDLGDLTPDTVNYKVTRNGVSVFLEAYRDGPRCPGLVKAQVQKASNAYRAVVYKPVLDDNGRPVLDDNGRPVDEFVEEDDVAWSIYLRDVLRAVIPSIIFSEAEVLAGQMGRTLDILRELGWIRSEEVDPNPEEPREETNSTTENSSQGSPQPTASPRKRSSRSRGASSRRT